MEHRDEGQARKCQVWPNLCEVVNGEGNSSSSSSYVNFNNSWAKPYKHGTLGMDLGLQSERFERDSLYIWLQYFAGLRMDPNRPLPPSVLLSNVRSWTNKLDELELLFFRRERSGLR